MADNGMAGEEGEVRVGAYLADDDVVGAGVVVQLLVPLLHHAALMRRVWGVGEWGCGGGHFWGPLHHVAPRGGIGGRPGGIGHAAALSPPSRPAPTCIPPPPALPHIVSTPPALPHLASPPLLPHLALVHGLRPLPSPPCPILHSLLPCSPLHPPSPQSCPTLHSFLDCTARISSRMRCPTSLLPPRPAAAMVGSTTCLRHDGPGTGALLPPCGGAVPRSKRRERVALRRSWAPLISRGLML